MKMCSELTKALFSQESKLLKQNPRFHFMEKKYVIRIVLGQW